MPATIGQVSQSITRGYCDVSFGIPVTPKLARELELADPYVAETLAFIVKDHRRDEFSSQANLDDLDRPRIGYLNSLPYYKARLGEALPHAELVPLRSVREFFEQPSLELDAMAYTAEAGSAWSLLYPAYSIVIPHSDIVKIPMTAVVARGDRDTADSLSAWLDLKRHDGTFRQLYNYWILGRDTKEKKPRWSVIRDVLGWVD